MQLKRKVLFIAGLLVLTLIFALIAQNKHNSLSTGYDFGVIAGSVHHMLQGNYYTIPDGVGGIDNGPYHFFSIHYNFFIYAVEPLYYLFPFAFTLFFIQSMALIFAAIPLFILFRKKYSVKVVVWICLAYLFNPLIVHAHINDLHFTSFVPLFLFLLILNWESDWLPFSLLLLSLKETVAIPLAILALVNWYYGKKNSKEIFYFSCLWIVLFFFTANLFKSESLQIIISNIGVLNFSSAFMLLFGLLMLGGFLVINPYIFTLIPALLLAALSDFQNHYGITLFYHEFVLYLSFMFIAIYHFKYVKKLYYLPLVGLLIFLVVFSFPSFDRNISPTEMLVADTIVKDADMSKTFYMNKKFISQYYYLDNVVYKSFMDADNIPLLEGYVFSLGEYTGPSKNVISLGVPSIFIYEVLPLN